MKNKRQRMRKFLAISLVVVALVTTTVFILTSFLPSLAQEGSDKEESDYEKEPLTVGITVTTEPDPPCLDSVQTSVKVTFEASASGGKCDSYKYQWSGKVSGTGESKTKTFKKVGTYGATVEVTCGEETASETASVEIERGECVQWDALCYGTECWPYYQRELNNCMNQYTADENFDYDACVDAAAAADKACGDKKCCIKWECK